MVFDGNRGSLGVAPHRPIYPLTVHYVHTAENKAPMWSFKMLYDDSFALLFPYPLAFEKLA